MFFLRDRLVNQDAVLSDAKAECAIVDLASQPASGDIAFGATLTTPGTPSLQNAANTLTKGLKMVTWASNDKCEVMIAFPGTNGEAKGMFGGMTWKNFITNGEHAPSRRLV
jgi:hypothetical protein